MQALTGNPHLDVRILARVNASTLSILAHADAYLRGLSQSNEFWLVKAEVEFGETVSEFKPPDISAHEFYDVYRDIYLDTHRHVNRLDIDSVLIAASKYGKVNTVKVALRIGANLNKPDKSGYAPLTVAVGNGHYAVVKELIRAGANVNIRDNDGYTPLVLAANAGDDHLEIVRELLRAGADINAVDNDGWTALMYASANGHLEIVKELLAHDANLMIRGPTGKTALDLANVEGHLAVAAELRAKHISKRISQIPWLSFALSSKQ